jgi:CBS domain-containing protein
MVLLGALLAIQTLSTSTRESFQIVGSSMTVPPANVVASTHDSWPTQTGGATDDLLKGPTSTSNRNDFAVIVCVCCMIVMGGLYLRLWRKRKVDLDNHEEAKREIQERSTALRQVLSKRNSIFNRIDDNWETILNGHAIVETYMSSKVVSVDPLMPKVEALRKMELEGFRRFMVKRKDGSFAGVVSRKDILSKSGDRVCDVMTSQARIARPETEIQTALSVLLENRISCLPVIKGKTLVGLLSVSDLLMVLQCLLRDLSTRSIDPAYIESQSHHDRCELLMESSDRMS